MSQWIVLLVIPYARYQCKTHWFLGLFPFCAPRKKGVHPGQSNQSRETINSNQQTIFTCRNPPNPTLFQPKLMSVYLINPNQLPNHTQDSEFHTSTHCAWFHQQPHHLFVAHRFCHIQGVKRLHADSLRSTRGVRLFASKPSGGFSFSTHGYPWPSSLARKEVWKTSICFHLDWWLLVSVFLDL